MKTTNIIQRLSLFLLALVLTMPTWAQGTEVVSISSAADWKTFCQRVNDNGEPFLNAKLTQDVDLGGEIVMLGSVSYPYSGTFDGNGHTLKFNWNAGKDNQIAPFYYVENATIKNLRTQGKITSKGNGLSGMVRAALGTTTISGCISDVDITGGNGGWNDSQAAGMVQAVAYGASVQITDCLVKGRITDNADEDDRAMAGFVLSNSGTYTLTRCLYVGKNNAANSKYSKTFGTEKGISAPFTDCYYLNTCGKVQGDRVTAEQLKNGEMAKLLQGDRTDNVWGQTLGTDNEPQLTAEAAKHVYEVKFTLNNEVKATRYANGGGSVATLPTAKELLGEDYNGHHYYAIAFEGGFNGSTTVNTDRTVAVTFNKKDYYEIASKEDWKAFCQRVNSGQTTLNAKLTQDVDLGSDIVMAGTENPVPFSYDDFLYYTGTFDGQGHTLKFNWNAGKDDRIAPFKYVKDATIKNLRTQGKITKKGYGLSGMVYIALGTTTISGCISDVDITGGDGSWNDSQAAGMVQAVADGASVTITDCLVKGSITDNADESERAMAGFVFSNGGTYTLTRCLYLGKNNATSDTTGKTFGTEKGISATFTDCYYLNPCGKAQGKQVTAERLKSGEMAKLLQGDRTENVWGQTLGTDNEPLPTTDATKRVYEVKFVYNGEVKATRYANRGGNVGTLPTPQEILGTAYNAANSYRLVFAEGFYAEYPIYADRTVAVDVIVNNMCEIATKEDWKKFGDLVLSGERKLNAKLTADLNLGTEILKIGSESTDYSGTFDGQGHTITVDWNGYGDGYFALFPFVTDATIKNLRVSGQMTTDAPMGVFSYLAGGTTIYEHCVSDVRITSGNTNSSYCAAGMVRAAYSEGKITFKDCIVAGDLNGTTDNSSQNMGGFVCSQADDATCTFDNCLYTSTNNSKGGYTFAPNPTLNNCYYLNPFANVQGTPVTAEQLASGEVTKKLQNNRTDKCYWAQQLGEMPDFYNAADKSKANYVYYDAAKKGWACDDFRLTDEQPLPIGLDFTAATVTYERNFNGTQKATLCLPYDLSAQGFKAYTLSGGNKNEVHFKETKDKLTAYTPYYITADGTPLLGGTNIEVKAYTGANLTTSANGYSIKGTVVSMDNATAAAANAYILQDDGMFHKVTTDNPGATVPAYHAYIICPPQASGAKQLSVVLDGETTGIGDVTNEATDGKNGPVYDLQGRRVADRLDGATRHSLPAGVYIVGGRKVVVK